MGNTTSHASSPSDPSTSPPSTSRTTAVPTAIPARGTTPASTPLGTLANTPPRQPSPALATPLLLPHAGHLSPQNPHALSHPQAHDYSTAVVTQLILDDQLAPFYRGLEDFEESWNEDDIGRALDETRTKDVADDVENSTVQRHKMGGWKGDVGERRRRELRAYGNAVECPICFLPLCTECFVQIKRGEPTVTHLESEPACCPFCVESDFGVIYERPVGVVSDTAASSSSALATSPDASGFSQAFSLDGVDIGPGMPPKAQEKARRKSVSSKSPEVVTIDQIRPDWEAKLNAVKAAAAKKASRRIVMRQVGDRLIPIGYTSARTGIADFSMSTGSSDNEGGSRRSRRQDSREQDLEQAMIAEAMRLSLISHDEEQRRQSDERRRDSPRPASVLATSPSSPLDAKSSTASKLLSKLGRSRASSKSSVTFATPTRPSPPASASSTPLEAHPSPTVVGSGSVAAPSTSLVNASANGLPRLSLDMPVLSPDAPKRRNREHEVAPMSSNVAYAQLDSDGE